MSDKDIEIIKADKHYKSEKSNSYFSYYHFSCENYYNPRKMNFGILRLFNDATRFDKDDEYIPQYYTNIEISYLVLSGVIDYRDELGNTSIISRDEGFRISSGRGLVWGTKNISDNVPLNLIEIWIFPKNIGKKPIFERMSYPIDCYENKIYRIIKPNTNSLDKEEYSIHITKITDQKKVTYFNNSDRLIYLYVKEGKITINNCKEMDRMDSAKIKICPNKELIIKNNNKQPAVVILVDIPKEE